jgi:hypothetical protein
MGIEECFVYTMYVLFFSENSSIYRLLFRYITNHVRIERWRIESKLCEIGIYWIVDAIKLFYIHSR